MDQMPNKIIKYLVFSQLFLSQAIFFFKELYLDRNCLGLH